MYSIDELELKLLTELREIADQAELKKTKRLSKQELVYLILEEQAVKPEAFKAIQKKQETSSDEVAVKEAPSPTPTAETETPKEAPRRRTRVRRQNVTASPEADSKESVTHEGSDNTDEVERAERPERKERTERPESWKPSWKQR